MDAKISISFAINNLQDLLRDDETTKNPRHKKLVQKSMDNLSTLKQFLKGVDDLAEAPSGCSMNDKRKTARLLKAVHSMEDAADTFVITKKYSQHVQKREREEQEGQGAERDDKFICCSIDTLPCCFAGRSCFCVCSCTWLKNLANTMKYCCKRFLFIYKLKSFHRWILFSRKMKKFNDEIRRLVDMEGSAGSTLKIENDDNTWLLSSFGSQWQHWGRISGFCLEEETQVVGLQRHIIKDLILQLSPQSMVNHNVGSSSVDEISEEQEQLQPTDIVISAQVIAVVGEGGSGKTTLARCVYNSIDVKKNFTNRAWVRIPRAFKARDVFVDILQQINQPGVLVDATLSEGALMWRITELLKGTRFLIVLEDVNMIDNVFESLIGKLSSPSHQDGKIIIITRNEDCSTTSVAHTSINICRLNDEESWKLFSQKVRIEEDELNNSELVTFKERIVNICGGLPLLIGLLGGLLSTKAKSCDEWTRIVSMPANKTSEDVMALCYQDLPIEVKPCFLYMGVFPKGFDIPVRRLILLWLAEGFVTPPELDLEIDPEDLAEMCIEELITRNMVEVRWRLDGSPKTCCLPSDLHDFVSSKAANAGFSFHHQVMSSHAASKYKKSPVRRLVANVGIKHFLNPLHRLHHLRSYLVFDDRVRITSARDVNILFKKIISDKGFGVLRLLDLEGVFKPTLSDQVVAKLLLLSYLGLRSTFIEHLPDSVGNLPYLETLDLRHTNIEGLLPELTPLRHIYLNFPAYDIVYKRVSTNLRTLWGLNIGGRNFTQELSKLRKIKKLGLTYEGDIEELSLKMADWIDQLIELQYLKLRSVSWRPDRWIAHPAIIKLPSLTKHQMLQELYLLGNLPQFVVDVGFLPPNLRKLTLSQSGLEEDPMPKLGQLPHLSILRLYSSSYKGERLTCLSNGFPKLKLLKLWKIPVGEWTVEEGAMPCLKELEIRSCENLKLPQGLQNVTTLKELVLTNMPTNFGAAVEEILKHRDVYIKNTTCTSHPLKGNL